MSILAANVAAITVVALYYAWRNFDQTARATKQRLLHERVAYMLWIMADDSPSTTREIRIFSRTG